MRSNLVQLFGQAQYDRVKADVDAGRDSYFEVPPEVLVRFEAEAKLAAKNEPYVVKK